MPDVHNGWNNEQPSQQGQLSPTSKHLSNAHKQLARKHQSMRCKWRPEKLTSSSITEDGKGPSRRRLSVSDLLNYSFEGYSEAFPLIDTKKYQKKAARAIYNPEVADTSVEIAKYLEKPVCPRSPPLLDVSTCYTYPDVDNVEKIGSPKAKRGSSKGCALCNCSPQKSSITDSGSVSSTHTLVMITKSLMVPFDCEECGSGGSKSLLPYAWFGCTIEYMPNEKKLQFQLQRSVLLSELGGQKSVKLFAKVSLLPDNLQKQRVRIVSVHDKKARVNPTVYFRYFDRQELPNMQLAVKIYTVRRGFFRRSRLLHEWTISLDSLGLKERHTVWNRIELSDL